MSRGTGGNALEASAKDHGFTAPLLEELASSNHERRAGGCRELGDQLRTGRSEPIHVLLTALGDSHPLVRVSAAEALVGGPPEAVEAALLEALDGLGREKRPGHRASVVHALGLLDRPAEGALLDRLLAETEASDQDVRFQAVASLNRLGSEAQPFAAVLPRLIGDSDEEVAAIAAQAAANFGLTELCPRILKRWRTARGFARRHLALAAAHLGSDEVVETLSRAMRDGIDAIEAVDALVLLGTPTSREALYRGARSWRVHPIVRARAGVALLEVGHAEGTRIVHKHLEHRRRDVRWSTLEWLGRAGLTDWRDILLTRLGDSRSDDSGAAAAALALLGDEDSLSALSRAAESDPRQDVRDEAAAALTRVRGESE